MVWDPKLLRHGSRFVHVVINAGLRNDDIAVRIFGRPIILVSGRFPKTFRSATGVVLGQVLSSWDVARERLILNPFRTLLSLPFVLLDESLNLFGMTAILPASLLDFERLHILHTSTGPRADGGLVARTQPRTGARVDAVIVIQRIFDLAVHAQVPVGPEAGLIDLLGGWGRVLLLHNGTGTVSVGLCGILFLLFFHKLFIFGADMAESLLEVRGVESLKLPLLSNIARATGPPETSCGFLL
jgi:hypothetical protein